MEIDEGENIQVENSSVVLTGTSFSSGNKDVAVNLVNGRQILINPNQRTRMQDPMDLVELARQVQTADQFNYACATSKLSIIVEQIRFLQEQARRVLEEAHHDQELHHVPCNFKKVAGQIYHLYEKLDGSSKLFSMLSVQDWGKSCPYRYLGTYKLQSDMSWTPAEQIPERDKDLRMMAAILSGKEKPSNRSNLLQVMEYRSKRRKIL